ncbi:segregation/condensation protein A [Streptomyces collinus]
MAEPSFPAQSAGPAASPAGSLEGTAPGPVDVAGPVARPVDVSGPAGPPAEAAGPVVPVAGAPGSMPPPADVSGPAGPSADGAEPSSPPQSAGPAVSSAGSLDGTAPGPEDMAGPVAPPVDPSGTVAPAAGVAEPAARPAGAGVPVAEPNLSPESAGPAVSSAGSLDGTALGPEDMAGPVAPPAEAAGPVDMAGPVAPPVDASRPLAPAAGASGPVASAAGVAGTIALPADVAEPIAPPAGASGPVSVGEMSPAAAETLPSDAVTVSERASVPAPGGDAAADDGVFKVRLANFEGPFDLLLQLISRHKMDVTEVALSKVTDEFMAHIRAMGPDWDLDETTEFLVVAATLLDLKAARLLPAAEVEDEGDLALLEARDLLFARLLQYRAYKQIADIFSGRLDDEARRYPRTVGLEAHHAELLPDVVISIGAEGFAKLAVKAMQPRPKPQVYVDHIHAPLVSVQEQAQIVVARLRELGEASFRALVADTDDTLTVVARFLALLELYREKAVALEQETALGDLLVRWTGGDGDETPTVTDEFDRPPEPPKEEKKA